MALILRESRIIFPQSDNNGSSLRWLQTRFEDRVVAHFGGFTMSEGKGVWESKLTGKIYFESVWFYDIAVINDENSKRILFEIARWLKNKSKQEAIYLRYPDGEVTFV